MGDSDYSRTPSTTDDNEFYESTERILKSCLEMESLGSTTQRLTISERCVVFVVKKHLEENPGFFDSSCEELRFSATDFHSRLNEVWEGIFSDEKINWGRILTMLCFCRSASVYSQRVGLPPSAVESIAPWATTFICSTLKDWIVSEGGWEAFPRPKNPQSHLAAKQQTGASATGWVEQGFKGLAFSLSLFDALRVR